MTETELRRQILAFAQHLGDGSQLDATREARHRHWLDASGRPTEDGAALVAALQDQSETRTVFRGNF